MRALGIGNDQLSSYLSIYSGGYMDMAENLLVEQSFDVPLLMGPAVEAWSLNMNTGNLTLTFSETVTGTAGGFDAAGLRLVNADASAEYTLSSATAARSAGVDTTHVVALSTADLDGVKLVTDLAVDAASCFLTVLAAPQLAYSLDSTSVGNPLAITPLADDFKLPVLKFLPDVTLPVLVAYEVNEDAGYVVSTLLLLLLHLLRRLRPVSYTTPILRDFYDFF